MHARSADPKAHLLPFLPAALAALLVLVGPAPAPASSPEEEWMDRTLEVYRLRTAPTFDHPAIHDIGAWSRRAATELLQSMRQEGVSPEGGRRPTPRSLLSTGRWAPPLYPDGIVDLMDDAYDLGATEVMSLHPATRRAWTLADHALFELLRVDRWGFDAAQASLRRALAALERAFGPDAPEAIPVLERHARALLTASYGNPWIDPGEAARRASSAIPAAARALRQALRLRARAGDHVPGRAPALAGLAELAAAREDLSGARGFLDTAREEVARLANPVSVPVAQVLWLRARLEQRRGGSRKASLAAFEAALRVARDAGAGDRFLIGLEHGAADARMDPVRGERRRLRGTPADLERAAALIRSAHARQLRVLGPEEAARQPWLARLDEIERHLGRRGHRKGPRRTR